MHMATVLVPATQPWWLRVSYLLLAFISAIGGVWWVTHDTPQRRAANEAIYLVNQGKELDVQLAKQRTKQMKIVQGETGNQSPFSSLFQDNNSPISIGSDGQHFLSKGMNFTFNGQGEDQPSATIAFKQVPVNKIGTFKIYAGGKTAWTESWSEEPSPYPLDLLLEETKSTESHIRWAWIYSKGQTNFNL